MSAMPTALPGTCNYSNPKRAQCLGDSLGLIPLGVVQPQNPQTLTLNLLRIEPKLMPTVHVRHAHSPSRNMQLFESQAGTKKASHFCEAFFVNPLVQNSNSFLEDLRRLNQLKNSPYQSDKFLEKVYQPKQSKNSKKIVRVKR